MKTHFNQTSGKKKRRLSESPMFENTPRLRIKILIPFKEERCFQSILVGIRIHLDSLLAAMQAQRKTVLPESFASRNLS